MLSEVPVDFFQFRRGPMPGPALPTGPEFNRVPRNPARISNLRFGFHCWPADGDGRMCSASQNWKLSSVTIVFGPPPAMP